MDEEDESTDGRPLGAAEIKARNYNDEESEDWMENKKQQDRSGLGNKVL